jgi:low affinity Fe/Cu permease
VAEQAAEESQTAEKRRAPERSRRHHPDVRRCRQRDLAGRRRGFGVHVGGRNHNRRGITGPLFQYSDTWQLVINTGTSVVTFLMVFLIQNSQNRDSAAIRVKLDELIRVGTAHNSFVGIEHLTDDELEDIRTKCERRAEAEKAGEASVKRAGEKAKEGVTRPCAVSS